MKQAEFTGLNEKTVVTFLRSFDPMWANKIAENLIRSAISPLVMGHEDALVDRAARIAEHVSDSYVKPNFGKSARILTCCVSDEGQGNQLNFSIPFTKTDFITIKVRRDLSALVQWPQPAFRALAGLMARLVLANDMRGWVLLEDRYRVSFRAALVIGLLGEELAAPFLDMAQEDGILEDYPCVSLTPPRALGMKSKKQETFLEL